MATDSSYPVEFFHRGGGDGDGDGQWCSLGAAYAAVRVLRPQGHSLVMYTGPDDQPHQRILFAYPILPVDATSRAWRCTFFPSALGLKVCHISVCILSLALEAKALTPLLYDFFS